MGYTGSWAEIQDSTATSKVMLKGADNSYFYRVRACKSVACSTWSNTKEVLVANGGGCSSQPLASGESGTEPALAPAAPEGKNGVRS